MNKTTTLAALLIAMVAATPKPATADSGEGFQLPGPTQIQVVAGQRVAEDKTATLAAGTLKGKDDRMYGEFSFIYLGVGSPTLETPLHIGSIGLNAGPHLKVGDAYILIRGGAVLPVLPSPTYPTVSADFRTTVVDSGTTMKTTTGTFDAGLIYRHDFGKMASSLELRLTPAGNVGAGWRLGEETSVTYTFGGPLDIKTGLLVRYTKPGGKFLATGVVSYNLTVTPGEDGLTAGHAVMYNMRLRWNFLPKPKPKVEAKP